MATVVKKDRLRDLSTSSRVCRTRIYQPKEFVIQKRFEVEPCWVI
jgi:hypothetical protein